MAEVAIASLASLFAGGGTAAATLGTAAAATAAIPGLGAAAAGASAAAGLGGLAATAAGGAGVLSLLQGTASIVSALGTIGMGLTQASESRQAAADTELQIGQDRLQEAQRSTQMKRELLSVLGENDVTFAAAGIDISSGIAAGANAEAQRRATEELSIERDDGVFRRALLRAKAHGYRARANSQVGGALLGALGTGLDFGIDLYSRG